MAQEGITGKNDIAKKSITRTEYTLQQLNKLESERAIALPKNYSAGNALKLAWFILQGVKDKNDRPALEVCTDKSIMQSLMDMCVQGLNPAKKQCYFIVRGKDLALSRSYFGVETALRTVNPSITRVPVQIVYEDDEFEYEVINNPDDPRGLGNIIVLKHVQKFANRDKKKIAGVYGYILYTPDGGKTEKILATDLMNIDEIHDSWTQSQRNVFDGKGNVLPTSTHGKFTVEMTKKTLISRLCKRPFNISDDSIILAAQAEAFARTTENENDMSDIEAGYEIIDPDMPITHTGPEPDRTAPSSAPEQPQPEPTKKKGGIVDMFTQNQDEEKPF